MTPQQIDALPAGRELDALVLVHVCGWRWWQYKQARKCQLIAPTMQSEETGTHGLYVDWPSEAERFRGWDFSVGYGTAPHVSTDIAAAWTVVEAMIAKRYLFSAHRDPEVGLWDVHFSTESYTKLAADVDSSFPLAACRAALKAVFAAKAQETPCKT